MSPDLFDFVVDDVVYAALRFEFCDGRVGGRQAEPLRAGLEIGLGEGRKTMMMGEENLNYSQCAEPQRLRSARFEGATFL